MLKGSSIAMGNWDAGSDRPEILGIWRLGEALHQGDAAEVCLAQPADSQGSPRWEYVMKRATVTEDEANRRASVEHSLRLAGAIRHPHLIGVLDGSASAATPYLVMPRLSGNRLSERAAAGQIMELTVTVWVMRRIAEALTAVHRGGWVHGDVRPQNIWMDEMGHATLIDLGFASPTHSALRRSFPGNSRFAAPELLRGDTAALPAMDVFAIGRVLQWSVDEMDPDTRHPGLDQLIAEMTAPRPGQRPGCHEVAERLLPIELSLLGSYLTPVPATNARNAA